MRENRNNQYRPEQIQLYKILRTTNSNCNIMMEYAVKCPIFADMPGRTYIGDIVNVTKKEYFRINGESHNVNDIKDADQKFHLEGCGWKVIDIDADTLNKLS